MGDQLSNNGQTRNDGSGADHSDGDGMHERLTAQARLARSERAAALQALAERLARQLQRPLEAIRRSCGDLHAEVEDIDQRETLALALIEIDRMLGHVTETLQSLPDRREGPTRIDLGQVLADVVAISQLGPGVETRLDIEGEDVICELPRDSLCVALFSILDHLAAIIGVGTIDIAVTTDEQTGQTLSLEFVAHETRESDGWPDDERPVAGGRYPVGLLVGERFASDLGGQLMRTQAGERTRDIRLVVPRHMACD